MIVEFLLSLCSVLAGSSHLFFGIPPTALSSFRTLKFWYVQSCGLCVSLRFALLLSDEDTCGICMLQQGRAVVFLFRVFLSWVSCLWTLYTVCHVQGCYRSWKVLEFFKSHFPRLESPGIWSRSWKVLENDQPLGTFFSIVYYNIRAAYWTISVTACYWHL